MTYLVAVIYWFIFAKTVLEIYRFISCQISIFISTLLFFGLCLFAVIALIPFSVFLAEKTIQFIQAHWR